jgi:hypothetical protein
MSKTKKSEIFYPIEEHNNYAVSNSGKVKNVLTKRVLKNFIDGSGYGNVDLDDENNSVHRLVATAFLPNPKNKPCVDHIDNNRTNNNVSNLRWATVQENMMNCKLKSNNTSGTKGVSFDKAVQKYKVSISFEGKRIHLGYYDDIKEATKIRRQAAKELYGEFINECEL